MIARLMIDLVLENIRLTDAELRPFWKRCALNAVASAGWKLSTTVVDETSFRYSTDWLASWKKVFLRPLPFNFKYRLRASLTLNEDGSDFSWTLAIVFRPSSLLWNNSSLRLSQYLSSLSERVLDDWRALACDLVRGDIITRSLLNRLRMSAGIRRE